MQTIKEVLDALEIIRKENGEPVNISFFSDGSGCICLGYNYGERELYNFNDVRRLKTVTKTEFNES